MAPGPAHACAVIMADGGDTAAAAWWLPSAAFPEGDAEHSHGATAAEQVDWMAEDAMAVRARVRASEVTVFGRDGNYSTLATRVRARPSA